MVVSFRLGFAYRSGPHDYIVYDHFLLSDFYTVTNLTTLPSPPLTNTSLLSLSTFFLLLVLFMNKRKPKTPTITAELRTRTTIPKGSRSETPPSFCTDFSHSPTLTVLRPTTRPQNPKASIQEPQDISAPPVITVTLATDTTPLGKVTVSDLGS